MTDQPTIARAISWLGRQPWLDGGVKSLGFLADRVSGEGVRRKVLEGAWLGLPVHPALTDVPIGFWTSAFVLDFMGPAAAPSADACVALGTVAALPTAATGLADWGSREPEGKRIGLVHAVCNVSAIALYLASWAMRIRGQRRLGVALSLVGAAMATLGGALGGHLAFGMQRTTPPSTARTDEPTAVTYPLP